MSPNPTKGVRMPSGKLLAEIEASFGTFEKFTHEFAKQAVSLFGSGTLIES
jgi:Fe-Mn family superoxide dismutase